MKSIVKDISLAEKGQKKIYWAESRMPVLRLIKKRFEKEKPLTGIRIACCLHVTTETACLIKTLEAGGAEVALYSSNPLSTKDDIAASLAADGTQVYAIHGVPKEEYLKHLDATLAIKPHICLDDGGDIITTIHTKRRDLIKNIIGGCEETTTGVKRFANMDKKGVLEFPIININDAPTKYLFDNRYGTGQSTIHGILQATNILLAGKNFVVAGYGWCSRGIAMKAKGMGANVIVTEVNPLYALEAVMDGFRVMPMNDAVEIGDIFITATGNTDIITKEHFRKMKDGVVLGNSGHFRVEVKVDDLEKLASKKTLIRDNLEEYVIDGKRLYLIGQGRLANLTAAEGHPPEVMDMSFANQALCVEYLVKNKARLSNNLLQVPTEISEKVAKLKLKAMGIKIDNLTEEQKKYLASWDVSALVNLKDGD